MEDRVGKQFTVRSSEFTVHVAAVCLVRHRCVKRRDGETLANLEPRTPNCEPRTVHPELRTANPELCTPNPKDQPLTKPA